MARLEPAKYHNLTKNRRKVQMISFIIHPILFLKVAITFASSRMLQMFVVGDDRLPPGKPLTLVPTVDTIQIAVDLNS